MRYNLNLHHHDAFDIFEHNKLSPRNYFIPHSSTSEMMACDFIDERRKSSMVIMLNGDWRFKYYPKCDDMPVPFDTETEEMDTITVPSDWQRTGYEHPNYLNSRYQFPLDPPKIPGNIPCGVYARHIDIDDLDKVYLIDFLGVCACFDLFVNGKYVGYSEGSHNTAEFDITDHLALGDNELVVVVYKWCNGSYLECQDMFRENGIFRDVYIIKENKVYIKDFGYNTTFVSDKRYTFDFDYTLSRKNIHYSLTMQLFDGESEILTDTFTENRETRSYTLDNIKEWSAESPNLYTLVLSLYHESELISTTRKYVGFKHVEIVDNVLYFNGKKIKLFGVNHHESDPKTGFVMTAEQLERDVQLLKSYNANCVRLSHYPHDPLFLTLCDKYGLYAVDEMDLECHGIYSNPLNANFGRISENLDWKEQFLDRAKRMYYRDRCHPSITMWSLGNEAGGDACHMLCYQFLKEHSALPVQYEGAIHTKQFSYDVVAEFYPSKAKLLSYQDHTCKDKRYYQKPYFMTEYAHSMGVGPGGLNDIVELVLANDNFLGGCIWEFCDHVAYNANGKYKMTYGGDYNEKKHDGNFCVDGLFFPDRSPSTGALNMRECYRPIRCKMGEDGKFTFTNNMAFCDSSDIDIQWTLLRNGKAVNSGKVDIIIPPQSAVNTDILCPVPRDMAEYVIQLKYTKAGVYVASEDFALTQPIHRKPNLIKPEYAIDGKLINITFDGGSMQVSKKTGEITSYMIGDKQLINQNPRLGSRALLPNMTRLTLDNDRFIKIAWQILGTLNAKAKFRSCKVNATDSALVITNKYSMRGMGKLATFTVTMTVGNMGDILVNVHAKKALKLAIYSDIVRCGVTLELDKAFDNVKYYGLGDRETLSDFDEHGALGVYECKVEDMHEKYIKPQESGNRSKVRWASVTDGAGYGIKVSMVDRLLNINANHYTINDVHNATHIEDIAPQNTTCLQIDGFMRGTGSQSCGPQPTSEHRPNLKKPLDYSFLISPVTPDMTDED